MLDIQQTPKDISFCTYTIEQEEPMVLGDISLDARFADSRLVKQEAKFGFYAGVPLKTSDDYAVGALCIMDRKPRQITAQQLDVLEILAKQATKFLGLRLERNKYRDLLKEKKINQVLKETAER